MLFKAVLLASLACIATAADASVKASGSNMVISADGTVTMQADGGTILSVSSSDISMTPGGDSSKTTTITDIVALLANLTTTNSNLDQLLTDLKANYSTMSSDLATMQTQYADTNKGYVTTMNDLKTQMSDFNTNTVQDVKTQYNSEVSKYSSSTNSSVALVGSLLSRYTTLTETRSADNAAAMKLLNQAEASAQAVLNNATSDSTAFASTATSSAGQASGVLNAATKQLTDGVANTNAAVTQGNTAVAAAAKSITDLSAEINSKLGGKKITDINTAAATLTTSVAAMMAELDDSFFSLDNSVNRMRALINADFSKYTEIKYVPDLVDSGDAFGQECDWTMDTVICGAYGFNGIKSTSTLRLGGAFIFTYNKTSKSFYQEAVMEGERNGDYFGQSVGIDGNTAIVGSPYYEPLRVVGGPYIYSSGAAYVYKKMENGTWMQSQKLIAPDTASGDQFGRAVSIDGNRLVVSAPYHEVPANPGSTTTYSTGIIYIYERTNEESDFLFVQAVQAPGAKAYDSLAFQSTSLVIRGDYIAAGASNAESAGSGQFSEGAVFIWTLKSLPGADGKFVTSWQPDTTLSPSEQLDSYDYFGSAVHMCIRNGQPMVAVGAYGDDGPNATVSAFTTGAVYVYGRTTTGFTSPTVVRDAELDQYASFGIDMAFDNDCSRLAITSNGVSYTGDVATYNVLANGGVSYIEKLQPSTGATYDYAGRGLVWGADFVGFGAYGHDSEGFTSGAFFAVSSVDIV